MSKLLRTMSFTILAVMLAALGSHFTQAAKPGGGGAVPAGTIYYEQYDNEPILRVSDPDELARLKGLIKGP